MTSTSIIFFKRSLHVAKIIFVCHGQLPLKNETKEMSDHVNFFYWHPCQHAELETVTLELNVCFPKLVLSGWS